MGSIQLQSHWQLQKIINTTHATILTNLTNSTRIPLQEEADREGGCAREGEPKS